MPGVAHKFVYTLMLTYLSLSGLFWKMLNWNFYRLPFLQLLNTLCSCNGYCIYWMKYISDLVYDLCSWRSVGKWKRHQQSGRWICFNYQWKTLFPYLSTFINRRITRGERCCYRIGKKLTFTNWNVLLNNSKSL